MSSDSRYVPYWGITPALDLLSEFHDACPSVGNEKEEKKDFKVLLLGGADCRHILKTITSAKRKGFRRLYFYIVENSTELYARQLLLLALAFEPSSMLSAIDKTSMFLEIYGNTLIRSHTYEYVKNKSNELIKIITEDGFRRFHLPFIRFKEMMYKELDALESVFKVWKVPEHKLPDVCQYWEKRLRAQYGTRYDSRLNLFDYDFSMKLTDKNAGMIGNTKYCNWRETGIAFDRRYGSYAYPNKTICSGHADHHLKYNYNAPYPTGFWGDIVTGPYIAYGIKCDEEEYLKKKNDQYTKNSDEISEFNIMAIMNNIETEIGNPDISIAEWLHIYFVSQENARRFQHQSDKEFDMVYFSSHVIRVLNPTDIIKLFKRCAMMMFETGKFILEWGSPQHTEYKNIITNSCSEIGFVPKNACDTSLDEYAVFINKQS